jgi:ferritin-like protein
MATWGLDNAGDILMTNYPIITGQFEIVQDLETSIREQLNDCFFNLEAGIDWSNMPNNQAEINILLAQINAIASQINGVTGIISLTANFDAFTRILTVAIVYKTIYSDDRVSQFLFD